MSTAAVKAEVPAGRPTAAWASLPARLMATFSGTVGFAVKIALLSVANGLAVWAAVILAEKHKWPALGVLIASMLAIDAIYLARRRAIPLKFLVPGTLLLLSFQVVPIGYTIDVAFTNYGTGHILTKAQAIEQIKTVYLSQPPGGATYTMAPAHAANGGVVLVLANDDNGKTYIGTREGLKPIPRASVKRTSDGTITAATGYTLVKGNELFTLDKILSNYKVPTSGQAAIEPQGLDTAVDLEPSVRYVPAKDEFVRTNDGAVFRDNGRGSFVAANGDELEPGWKASVGFKNFSRFINDPLIRDPFLRVLAWTLAFATLTVLFSFALGLLLAITLDKQGLRFQRLYRSILVIPYAIPGFLSLLVWKGLLNDDFGVINRNILHAHIPWLFGANMAKVSILLVSTWLTFPYFFLVSLGALQSIPAELKEAARVDGGGAWQVFRKITLPLLVVVVAPLLIASFAFNFNNFGNIYLLTQGGPQTSGTSTAGATDILISYTYKLAFSEGKGHEYGLAAALSILIFFIVATISAVTFWRTKALENVR